MAAAEIFHALGDPLRLEMVQRLSNGTPCTITAVSHDLGITRQGARKHLQVLVDAQVIRLEPKGRDVFVHLDRAALDQARSHIVELERRWDQRLEALRRFVETMHDKGVIPAHEHLNLRREHIESELFSLPSC